MALSHSKWGPTQISNSVEENYRVNTMLALTRKKKV